MASALTRCNGKSQYVREVNLEAMSTPSGASAHTPYKEIHAVMKGLELLEAASDLGWAKVGELATYTGINRGTLYRLIHTLEIMGYVTRRAEDGAISLTDRVGRLADGVRQEDLTAQMLSPLMRELTERVMWPSDFATFVAGQMVILASSHKHSAVSVHRRLIGKTRPLLRSALGLAYLSSLTPDALQRTLDIARRTGALDADEIASLPQVHRAIAEVHHRGYAVSVGLVEQNISAIAVPVRLGRKTLGAVNIVYFRSAMSSAEAASAYLRPLRELAGRAEALMLVRLEASPHTTATDPVE